MKKVAVVVSLVIVALGVVALVVIGSPRGPSLQEVGELRQPRLTTLPAQKVVVVTATGDPKVVGKRAFGLLMGTYFKLDGVPRGGKEMKAPRARWPLGATVPVEQWAGLYAMPVPDSVTALPEQTLESGLRLELTTWTYGTVAEVLHVGAYDDERPTIEKLKAFIAEQGYEIAGDHEEEYLRGPGMIFAGDPATYLTVIRYPVRRKSGKMIMRWNGPAPDASSLSADAGAPAADPTAAP